MSHALMSPALISLFCLICLLPLLRCSNGATLSHLKHQTALNVGSAQVEAATHMNEASGSSHVVQFSLAISNQLAAQQSSSYHKLFLMKSILVSSSSSGDGNALREEADRLQKTDTSLPLSEEESEDWKQVEQHKRILNPDQLPPYNENNQRGRPHQDPGISIPPAPGSK